MAAAFDCGPNVAPPGLLITHNNRADRVAPACDETFEFLTYQLPTVVYSPTVAMTGN